ncbi:MAG: polysaccharide deacetylase family protein [Pseudomonadota bacterium]
MPHSGTVRMLLDGMYYSRAHRLLSPVSRGFGSFLMLHHVRPQVSARGFAPHAGLEITPEFLDEVITFVRGRGIEIVSFEEGVERIRSHRSDKAFAVITLDDGYLDNYEHAWPIFQKHNCPFTVFIASDITDGKCELWWQVIGEAIEKGSRLQTEVAGETLDLPVETDKQKQEAFLQLYKLVRWGLDEQAQRKWTRRFAEKHDIDWAARCREQAMTWDQVREINEDPLCTIGAHTVHHYSVGRLSEDDAYLEMFLSKGRLAEELGETPKFFCYPYGDEISAGVRDFALAEKAGFEAAVTTRKGMIYRDHADHLLALPRVSINGDYQEIRYLDVLMSGLPFMLANRFKTVNAA